MKYKYPFYKFNTVIVGSGAAGLNAAISLYEEGQRDIAIVTEGLKMGTSRNTGSDKQTYYKMSLSGDEPDSIGKMAKDMFAYGCVDGDIALVESACSVRSFFHLVDMGVPFPTNEYGEYVGYKTDHDSAQRGISAGPYTSKYMTEALEKKVREYNIPIFDGYLAMQLLVNEQRACGVVCLNKKKIDQSDLRYAIFSSTNVIWATGGEAGMYKASVYPMSQSGGMGVLLKEGAIARNLTESQFGIASIQFRWNLSGSFQQCLPRYISTDEDGNNPIEFLNEYFSAPQNLIRAVFLKGYQWPFDVSKICNEGSSLIDILVYQETVLKGRRVFLDFMHDPESLLRDGKCDFSLLSSEAYDYLKNCDALCSSPVERLERINPSAIEVYKDHHIDLHTELLEIAVCAQHSNGGIEGNSWWESSLKHLFPVGEVNGSHGVYRPGGSALNAGQVGGLRASHYIVNVYDSPAMDSDEIMRCCGMEIENTIHSSDQALHKNGPYTDLDNIDRGMKNIMTHFCAFVRSTEGCKQALQSNRMFQQQLDNASVSSPSELIHLNKLKSLCISQFTYICAINNYIKEVGISRGSYLVHNERGELPCKGADEIFRNVMSVTDTSLIQEIKYNKNNQTCNIVWRKVRPIPERNLWFEKSWQNYLQKHIYQCET